MRAFEFGPLTSGVPFQNRNSLAIFVSILGVIWLWIHSKRQKQHTSTVMQQSCIFCRIASHLVEQTTLLSDDDLCVSFHDISPVADFHILVVPKLHIPSISYLDHNSVPLLQHMKAVAERVAQTHNIPVNSLVIGFTKYVTFLKSLVFFSSNFLVFTINTFLFLHPYY